jgi:hypothetical protein
MSRPRDDFDWNLVESLAMVEASESFIAERLIAKDGEEINAKTIQAKIKMIQRRIQERYECSFVQFRTQKLENRKIQLRSWQWKAAEKGNATLLIWLGKQYLGQAEKSEIKDTGKSFKLSYPDPKKPDGDSSE